MLRYCPKCKEEKNLSEYRRDKNSSSGFSAYCKVCFRAYQKSAYAEKYGARYKDQNTSRRHAALARIRDIKAQLVCQVCNESEPCTLCFHHIDDQSKDFDIGGAHGLSWQKVVAELAKCTVVCHNCHSKIHSNVIVTPTVTVDRLVKL